MNNYHEIFTYESIEYAKEGDQRQTVAYSNCVMLKDVGEMKKGMFIPFISISYGILGWDENDELVYDEATTDTRTN